MFPFRFNFSRSLPSRVGPALLLASALLASVGCNEMLGITLGHPLDDSDKADSGGGDPTGGEGGMGGSGGAGTATGGSGGGTSSDAGSDTRASDISTNDAPDSNAMCSKDVDCSAYPHVRPGAPVTCVSAKCKVPDSSCVSGWAHCSNNADQFCETDVTTADHCGTCGNVCGASLPRCRSGACVSQCMGMTPDLCDGVCVDTKSDLKNCGQCNQNCAFPNADATCSSGVCQLGTCKPGYGDCTSAAGCETRLNTLTDCGACNTPCVGTGGGVGSCETGTCVSTCTPKGPEDCYNGVDDDCDGKLDCEDTDCTRTSICEPVGTAAYGTTVGSNESCPAGFNATSGTPLYSGLSVGPTECTGCSCTADCTPISVRVFADVTNCNANVLSGSATIDQTSPVCGTVALPSYTVFTVSSTRDIPGCTAKGTATRTAPTWTNQQKFCAAPPAMGGGCQSGFACVPKPPVTACLLSNGNANCEAGHTPQSFYTGYDDARVCGCECSAFGACSDLQMDTSSLCNGSGIGALSTKKCIATANAVTTLTYAFPAGSPPSCSSNGFVARGALTPTGTTTLCCRQP